MIVLTPIYGERVSAEKSFYSCVEEEEMMIYSELDSVFDLRHQF